jgi:phasin family protein
MQNELFEQWINISKEAAEPMMKLNQLSMKAMEQVARQQLEIAQDYIDLGVRQAELLQTAEGPQQWIAAQGDLTGEFSKKLMGRADSFMKLAGETQKEMTEWAEQNAEMVKEKMNAKAA